MTNQRWGQWRGAMGVLWLLCACAPPTTSGAGGGGVGATGGGSGATGGGTALADGGDRLDGGDTLDGGVTEPDGGDSACTEISLDAFQLNRLTGQFVSVRAPLATSLGDAANIDVSVVQFYQGGAADGASPGTYDLSAEPNWATCSRCVAVQQDYFARQTIYFQSSGSMTLNATSDVLNGTVSATLSDVRLDEVTVVPSTYQTTRVPDGGCLHITSASIEAAPPPTPYPVNPDGGCGVLELGLFGYVGPSTRPAGQLFRTIELYPMLNSTTVPDFVAVDVTNAAIDAGQATGAFDLSQNGEDNLATCAHCVYLSVDASPTGAAAVFMASSGTLLVDAQSDVAAGKLKATLSNVKFVESTYDSTTLETTPIPNGRCLLVPLATVTGR